jgi:hypothetical protein
MWKPRRLTTLWAFTASYRDSFTFTLPQELEVVNIYSRVSIFHWENFVFWSAFDIGLHNTDYPETSLCFTQSFHEISKILGLPQFRPRSFLPYPIPFTIVISLEYIYIVWDTDSVVKQARDILKVRWLSLLPYWGRRDWISYWQTVL